MRAERPAFVVASPPAKGGDSHKLAVTRSLGHAHLQAAGLTWEPAVVTLDLLEPAAALDPMLLLVGRQAAGNSLAPSGGGDRRGCPCAPCRL